ncbi:MAG: mannonate dehydratase, partial [Candidatus Poribacteria bacterium]
QRTERTPGRGGSSYSTFDITKYDNETLSDAGRVSREEAFERIAYFLGRVIPVAEESRVQMAAHLNDPPAPVLRGVERWNYPMFEGLKRFVEIVDSPYHGFNFCCGTASEGLDDPGKELYEIVRYFGERQKIFNIHFRNIRGGLHNFQEVWPDEGDVDMYKLAKVLRDVEYPYMLMPDHAPFHRDDTPPSKTSGRVRQAWSFQFGYIIALIQAVNSEA